MVLVNVVILVVGTGIMITVQRTALLHAWQYFTGFMLIYVSTILMEGVSMSLMSKVMSPLLAKGFWNAGLLATEAGAIGRLLGNTALMVLGYFMGTAPEGAGLT